MRSISRKDLRIHKRKHVDFSFQTLHLLFSSMLNKKTQLKKKKKNKEFYSLHPSLSYIECADSKQLDRNGINIGYKSTLESLIKSGNRECRKQARCQNAIFEVSLYENRLYLAYYQHIYYCQTRNNSASELGKMYKQYWELRDSKAKKTTSSRTVQQSQQMATENTINLAQIAWGNIQT